MTQFIAAEGLSALVAAAEQIADARGERGSETPVSHPTGEESLSSPLDIRTELRSMTTAFARQMARLSSRLDSLSERVDGSATPRRVDLRDPVAATAFSSPLERNPALWCDRPLDEPIPNDTPVWPDEEDPALEDEPSESTDGCQLHQVSTATGALLKEAFSAVTTNGTRRRWRRVYGMPAVDATKCPKLDGTLKTQLPKEGKDGTASSHASRHSYWMPSDCWRVCWSSHKPDA